MVAAEFVGQSSILINGLAIVYLYTQYFTLFLRTGIIIFPVSLSGKPSHLVHINIFLVCLNLESQFF